MVYLVKTGWRRCKKALLKSLNVGKSLKKSFDRSKRVRDVTRNRIISQESVVTRAFKFSHDTSVDPNSGADRLCSGDYCCAIIKSKTLGVKHTAIGKFQRFGEVKQAHATELCWTKHNADYRAAVNVVGMIEYMNCADQLCLRVTGEIISSLSSMHSSCIEPISPTMESVETSPNGCV